MKDRIKKAGASIDLRQLLAREEGAIVKNWGGRLPIALVYPNSYYLGMSNLGIQTIYELLNSQRNVVCERVFWEKDRLSPLSIESRRPLADFAVIAFSISYELDYFNVARILRESGIPLYASERDERYPLVIAGGPCISANPMPLSPFFDCLCIGEAEAIIPGMLPILFEYLGDSRDRLLQQLAHLPGIYVPEINSAEPVTRQWLKDLDDYPVHSVVLTPDTELGDLFLVEAERGCNWGCRFCLVCSTFSPMRFRSAEKIIEQAQAGMRYRKRIGLVGAAVSSHPYIEGILSRLLEMGAGLSISSLRINPLPTTLLQKLAQGRARTVTLAPEAGTQRLRQVIKKGVVEEDILSAIGAAAECGVKQIKLYFMLGLPSETEEDVEGIISLALKAKDTIDRRRSGIRLILNVAPFVPKAGTPFQWLPMESVDVLNRRLALLKSRLPAKGIKVNNGSPAWSEVQAALARGGAELARVLEDVQDVTLSNWRRTVEKHCIDTDFYAHQRWNTEQKLPWGIIESGIKPEKLEKELTRALA